MPVSIPFISGLHLNETVGPWMQMLPTVSIPFISGLHLNDGRPLNKSSFYCLNPFYFRASFKSRPRARWHCNHLVSIPFISGLHLNSAVKRTYI